MDECVCQMCAYNVGGLAYMHIHVCGLVIHSSVCRFIYLLVAGTFLLYSFTDFYSLFSQMSHLDDDFKL